ncbi:MULTISPECIES: SusC/RagA family TonB-linked outer membrane protein [Sphingobacterium]|uniref:SusC/RagA family TonB-linked outer membrane protein n=1 Tax=Sphingobacterium TaxID=28453 RepID=UPI00257DA1BA|nr:MULTISPECIES: SusC/RagA family TonB-linked outer membrane protein [Sphingobacterium]
MARNRIIWLLLMLLVAASARAQLSGTVLDKESGLPIKDVNIVIKDAAKAKTDNRGRFSIAEKIGGQQVTFRHIAYQDTSIFVKADRQHVELTVSLALKHGMIDEVVINTGYQSIPKDRVTGSFSSVSKQQLEQQIGRGITGMLPSLANGVMLDNNSTSANRLMVRSLSTIKAEKNPLVVVDNFPYEGNLDDINPLDIENVTVLKDAAASAIWGVRAGNGVIVVTTKKGQFNQRQRFRFSTAIKTGAPPDLNRLDLMSTPDFIGVEEFLFNKGYYNSRINSSSMLPLSPVVEALDRLKKQKISQEEYDNLKAGLVGLDVRDEYRKHFYSNSLFQQYHLQGNGGSSQFAWMSSLGYDKEVGSTKNRSERLTYKLNNALKIRKDMLLSMDLNLIHFNTSTGMPAYGDVKMSTYELYPYATFADDHGIPLRIAQRNNDYVDRMAKEGYILDWNYYPLTDYRHQDNGSQQWIVNWNTGLKYDVSRSLSIDLKYNLMLDRTDGKNLHGPDSYFSRNLVNSFSEIDRSTGVVTYHIPKGGVLDQSVARQTAHNARLQLNFNRTIDVHGISGILGFEGRMNKGAGESSRFYGYNPTTLSFANVDYTSRFPDLATSGLNTIPNGQSLSQTEVRYLSVFANAVYSYKNKVNLSGSVRRDATNLFGLRTNDKWNLLWSVGASWKAMENKGQVDKLTMRATYGFSGNVDPSMASVNTIQYIGSNVLNNFPIATFASYANPELKWESIATLNLGTDLVLWKNKLNLTFDWYAKKGSDLYGLDEMDPTAGIGATVVRNSAKMKASGLDLAIGVNALEGRDWGLRFQINLSRSTDKVEKYYLNNAIGRNFINERTIAGIVGKPVYSLFAYPWKGLDTDGNPIGYMDGVESKDYRQIYNNTTLEDMVYEGPTLPRWFGSAGSSIRFRKLTVDFRLLYKLGHYIRSRSIDYSALFAQNITHADYELRWQEAGDENKTSVPAMIYPLNTNRENYYRNASVLIEPASNIRLQYVNLQYNLEKILQSKIDATMFLNVENVGLLWKATKKDFDPEYENRFNAISPPRQWSFGCRISF